jgi:hypothetical protein
MAHYALIDENNIVTQVITGIDETDTSQNWEEFYGELHGQLCKRTSYNNNIRNVFAGVNYIYNSDLDVFYPPKPFSSWTLNLETLEWNSPVSMPKDGKPYIWKEQDQEWVEVI